MKIAAFFAGLVLFVAIALAAEPAPNQTIIGHARVIDGDTLEVAGVRVRLAYIDAPEASQTCVMPWGTVRCGEDATNALRGLIAGREVTCERRDTDRYGRMVAVCIIDPRGTRFMDLNREMVARGFAIAYRRYSLVYVAEEEEAKHHRLGVWASFPEGFIEPERWRREHGR